MARRLNKLSAAFCKSVKSGTHGDGGNLWLRADDGKAWVLRFKIDGKAQNMGLGPYPAVSLSDAREKAAECRALLAKGINPRKHRDAQRAAQRLEDARAKTFRQCSEEYIAALGNTWTEKTANQVAQSLEDHAGAIRDMLIADIDKAAVLEVLQPIWNEIPETAFRVQNRIENVIDFAAAMDYHSGSNPARWKNNLNRILKKKKTPKHHPALAIDDMPAFMVKLRSQETMSRLALEWCILTGTRTKETLGAEWCEIQGNTWTVPGERMKKGVAHRVPLSTAALAILDRLRPIGGKYVFPGQVRGQCLNPTALSQAMRSIEPVASVHGCRSTLRDWLGERTNAPRAVAEKVLAHAVKDASEAAYQRSDLLEKRRPLMEQWSSFINGESNIVAIKSA